MSLKISSLFTRSSNNATSITNTTLPTTMASVVTTIIRIVVMTLELCISLSYLRATPATFSTERMAPKPNKPMRTVERVDMSNGIVMGA